MQLVHIKHELPVKPADAVHVQKIQEETNFDSSDSGYALLESENGDIPQKDYHQKEEFYTAVAGLSYETRKIIHLLQILVDRENEKDKSDLLAKRWMEASVVIDRSLFWIFFICTAFSTFIILVVIPIMQR